MFFGATVGWTKKENKVEIESRKVNEYVQKSRRERRRGKGSGEIDR
jgi:hypothetical protein